MVLCGTAQMQFMLRQDEDPCDSLFSGLQRRCPRLSSEPSKEPDERIAVKTIQDLLSCDLSVTFSVVEWGSRGEDHGDVSEFFLEGDSGRRVLYMCLQSAWLSCKAGAMLLLLACSGVQDMLCVSVRKPMQLKTHAAR